MLLYHGTDKQIGEIDYSKSRLRTDFGKGFYFADQLGTSRDWAAKTAAERGGIPTVMRYNFNDDLLQDILLKRLRFNAPTTEWLDFVKENRRVASTKAKTPEPRHDYDVVSGPIANDKVARVVALYCRGSMTMDEAIQRIKAIPNVYQLSIHTELAKTYVIDVHFQQYKNGKWCAWKRSTI